MPEPNSAANENETSRDRLAELLNEDLARECQAIIAYVVYPQVLTGAESRDIAAQLEIHAKQELDRALILSQQIDDLGRMPVVTPKPVRTSKHAKDMLRYDLDNENEPSAITAIASGDVKRWENSDGGTDSPDSHAGTGPSNRFGDCPGRSSSRPERRS
ncbi:MAG: ferritin-like domain-containing protein [Candidatus Sulfotelmatobacter sp.]|jgi:hypothetical protein